MPNGIVVRPRLASLALVAALAASSAHVASGLPPPRRALFQVQDTVAESVASISQAVADVADSAAQAVVDVATRVAEEVEASMAPAPAPEARRRSLLQSSVLKRLEEEIMKEQRKIAVEFEVSMAPAPAPESVMGDGDDYVDAEAPEADETRRRSLLTYDMAPAPAPADDAIDVEEYKDDAQTRRTTPSRSVFVVRQEAPLAVTGGLRGLRRFRARGRTRGCPRGRARARARVEARRSKPRTEPDGVDRTRVLIVSARSNTRLKQTPTRRINNTFPVLYERQTSPLL